MFEVVPHAKSPCLLILHRHRLGLLTRRPKRRDGVDIERLIEYVDNNPVQNDLTIIRHGIALNPRKLEAALSLSLEP